MTATNKLNDREGLGFVISFVNLEEDDYSYYLFSYK